MCSQGAVRCHPPQCPAVFPAASLHSSRAVLSSVHTAHAARALHSVTLSRPAGDRQAKRIIWTSSSAAQRFIVARHHVSRAQSYTRVHSLTPSLKHVSCSVGPHPRSTRSPVGKATPAPVAARDVTIAAPSRQFSSLIIVICQSAVFAHQANSVGSAVTVCRQTLNQREMRSPSTASS